MTKDLENALERYVSQERLEMQRQIERRLAQLIGEARSRQAAFDISLGEQKSRDFLSGRLRELSR